MDKNTLQFLIKSRQRTYASGMKAEVVNAAKIYVIKEGDLEYRDSYYDQHLIFQGQEILLQNNIPIWSTSYRGAAIEGSNPSEVFAVLQKFIKEYADKVRFGEIVEKPEGDYNYICKGDGELNEFTGREEVLQNNKLVHWMEYFGGEIK